MFFWLDYAEEFFVNTSSILDLHSNQAHQYIRIVKTKRMFKTIFRISFFFYFEI